MHLIDVPLEGLDMGSYVQHKQEGVSTIYDLFAVSNHMGSLSGGHYTAIARNFKTQQWFEFDDSTVSGSIPKITAHAYVLFFKRRD